MVRTASRPTAPRWGRWMARLSTREDRYGGRGRVFRLFRARALLLAPVLLAAGSLLPQQSVYATLAACRSDPIVLLSNGAVLDLSATISDHASDVNRIVYVLHGPAGTTPLAVIHTNAELARREQFTYHADQPAQTYTIDTYVATGAGSVPVTAAALASSLPALGTVSTSGYSGQDLHLHL